MSRMGIVGLLELGHAGRNGPEWQRAECQSTRKGSGRRLVMGMRVAVGQFNELTE